MRFDSGLKSYIKTIGQTRVLSHEEEIELFQRIEAGDEQAKEELVEANLRFVVKIAVQYAGRTMPLADLIQEGNVGLLEVIDKFDYRKGYRFSTYAAFWIRQAIQRAIRRSSGMIRLPVRKSRLLGKIAGAIMEYIQEHGSEPSPAEIASRLDVPEKKVVSVMKLRESVVSLEAPLDREDTGYTLLDTIPSESVSPPWEDYLDRQRKEKIEDLLDFLSEKEQRIIKLRFGFDDAEALSLRKTSKIVNLSQEGVRRIEIAALSKLRRPNVSRHVAELLA